MFDLSEFIGREVKDCIFELEDLIEGFEFDGDSGTYDVGYRRYSQDKESEEYNWHLTTSVYFEIEDDEITEITKNAEISSSGDSGLGECDPDDEWTNEDYEEAVRFFKRITKKPYDPSKRKLLNRQEFEEEFKKYFKKYHHCDDYDIEILMEDLNNPYAVYQLPYYRSEYEDTETIDGKEYSREKCWFDFTMFQTFSNEYPFEHYIYYNLPEDSHTVQDYVDADKLYEVIDTDED